MSRELMDSLVVVALLLCVFAIAILGAREIGQTLAEALTLPQP